jgi:hypothetical protein
LLTLYSKKKVSGQASQFLETMLKYGLSSGHEMQLLSLTNGVASGHGYFPVFMYLSKAPSSASSGTKMCG